MAMLTRLFQPERRQHVSRNIRIMGRMAGWENIVRCLECGHVYNPDNPRMARRHTHMDHQDEFELAAIGYHAFYVQLEVADDPEICPEFKDVHENHQNAWRAAADAIAKELHRRRRADR